MKGYFTLTILLLFPFAVESQIIGVKAGPVFSKINYSNSWSNNIHFDQMHFGYFAGLDISYMNSEHFELNSNVGFLWAGGRGTKNNLEWGTQTKAKSSMGFLTISSQARFKFPLFKAATFYLGVGPRIDIPLTYKENVHFFESIDFYANSPLMLFETSGGISKLLYGVVAETGYKVQRGKNTFGFFVSYNYNVNKLFDLYISYDGVTFEHQDWAWLNYLNVGFNWGINCSKN